MYRHLLVPIDATDLSVEIVGNAVAFARTVGAHITFFHAVRDPGGSLLDDAETLRAASPEQFAYLYTGRARELLAKAEAAARAFGVACSSLHVTSDRPASAIVDAARSTGCDLIFMASHGSRSRLGMALASETLDVLMRAGLPVLVAATGEPTAPSHAISVIRDEHRSLAAVLHAWTHALAEARADDRAPDAELMAAIVRYLERFPVALHHPKEEQYLFRRLRDRTSSVNAELDELERQHVRDGLLVAELAQRVETLLACEGDDEPRRCALAALQESLERYCSFMWDHLGREEGVVLPAAQRHLRADDWVEIDAAFSEHRHPRFDGDTGSTMRQLFSRIVNLA